MYLVKSINVEFLPSRGRERAREKSRERPGPSENQAIFVREIFKFSKYTN